MFLSKIWFLLVSLAAVVGFGAALAIPNPAMREITTAKAIGLDRTQHNAELLLRLNARDWIDAAASLARDQKLVELLEQASERRGDIPQIKANAAQRLVKLISGLRAERRPELIIGVDIRGKQIVRIGAGEKNLKPGRDGLVGYPLVEAALRGYRLDDTWNVDGKLYMMVASPAISRARSRYVGAILLGRAITDAYAKRMTARLGGAQLMFFLRGNVAATTLTSASLNVLPRIYERQLEQIAKDGRSSALQVGTGRDSHSVILAPLPGEAKFHDAFYAVVAPPAPVLGLADLGEMVRGEDVTSGQILLLGGAFMVILVIGLGLMIKEADLPTRRFLNRVNELGKGELSRLDESEFSASFGDIARSVNAGLERAEKRTPASKDIGGILGSQTDQATTPALRVDPSFSSMPPLAPMQNSPGAGAGGSGAVGFDDNDRSDFMGNNGYAINSSEPGESGGMGAAETFGSPKGFGAPSFAGESFGASSDPSHGRGSYEVVESVGRAGGGAGPSIMDGGAAPVLSSPIRPHGDRTPINPLEIEDAPTALSIQSHAVSMSPGADSPLGHEPLVGSAPAQGNVPSVRKVRIPRAGLATPSQVREPLPADGSGIQELPPLDPMAGAPGPAGPATAGLALGLQDSQGAIPGTGPRLEFEPEPQNARKQVNTASKTDELTAYFQEVYNQFVAIKRQCGENTDNLTLERFEKKLKRNRKSLIDRYQCKSVKFQVYVKDGKAAIKATPIKD